MEDVGEGFESRMVWWGLIGVEGVVIYGDGWLVIFGKLVLFYIVVMYVLIQLDSKLNV